jgi:hypothetical protein
MGRRSGSASPGIPPIATHDPATPRLIDSGGPLSHPVSASTGGLNDANSPPVGNAESVSSQRHSGIQRLISGNARPVTGEGPLLPPITPETTASGVNGGIHGSIVAKDPVRSVSSQYRWLSANRSPIRSARGVRAASAACRLVPVTTAPEGTDVRMADLSNIPATADNLSDDHSIPTAGTVVGVELNTAPR